MFLARFIRTARHSPILVALAQQCDRLSCGWQSALRLDPEWLFLVMSSKLSSLGHPHECLGQWVVFIRDHPSAWRKLVNEALQHSVSGIIPSCPAAVDQHPPNAEVPPAPSDPDIGIGPPVQLLEHPCLDCSAVCPSRHSLAVHRSKVHNYMHPARILIGDTSTCRVCLVNFWIRPRLLRHLREERASAGHTACLQLLLSFAEEIPQEELMTLNRLEAQSCRASRRAGHQRPAALAPPAPSHGPRRQFPGHRIAKPRFRPRGPDVA